MGSNEERQEYLSCYTYLINNLKKPYEELPKFQNHYVRLLENYVPYATYGSGFTVVKAYKSLESSHNLTPENIRLANILGLCVDMCLCSYLVTDDIMDSSETRFGVPCWYRNADVGTQAIIDIVLLENSPFMLFKNYFSNHNCYIPLMELFRKVNFKAAMGQILDMMVTVNEIPQFHLFTMNVYQIMVENKSGYPFFVLPTVSALHLAGKAKEELHKDLKSILLRLGEYIQVQVIYFF
ncbi:hypothetical protein ILUMI_23890 [Ignelater luminosus]|uniref:Farnesyl diphosphate synthase n=1 Tax=Ignelater luminosus TaxID=2038154 RepID=A0A8K0FWR7_IGNLU|nr:hypothetical protein ILUMI_23890 [Ignelater luminosus]